MADFLVIDDVEVPVARPSASSEPDATAGEITRAFSLQARSTVQGVKRRWTVTTAPLDPEDADDVIEAAAPGSVVECWGEMLDAPAGGSAGTGVDCIISVTGVKYVAHRLTHRRALTLTLREV